MRRQANVWTSIGAAFVATAAAALVALVVLGYGDGGLRAAIDASARVAFAPFWLAYAGGALAALGVPGFLSVRARGRELGLAFAAALSVHLALVAWLIIRGAVPALRVFIIFGLGAFLTLLLTLLSIPALSALFSRPALSRFRSLAMTYIAFAFLLDFAKRPVRADLAYLIAYVPFALLVGVGLAARLLAWVRSIVGSPPRSEEAR
jgi:hypothetical protein